MIQLFDPNHEIKRSLRPSGKARLAHCFNSRLREEATARSIPTAGASSGFNSRLREEATGRLYSN